MIALNAAAKIDDRPRPRYAGAFPTEIVALEAFLAGVMGADAAEVARGLRISKAAAMRRLLRAYRMGLVARVDRGFYSVHVRQAREARIP